jgi:hypothetical protein
MDNIYLLPAALFPAIPLMMISFGNRYTTLATLIRKIHNDLMSRKLTKKDKETNRYLKQIDVLRKRLTLNRATSTLAAMAFITNLIAIYFAYVENFTSFGIVFTASLVMFGLALILYIIELQLATKALDTHLQDLAEL